MDVSESTALALCHRCFVFSGFIHLYNIGLAAAAWAVDSASFSCHGTAGNWQVVDGVRRVWGTMHARLFLQNCTLYIGTVDNCGWECWGTQKLKKRGNTEVRWWFLIRSEETFLQNLEQEWVKIENSTSWKLEHCYQPVSTSATHDLVGEEDIAHTTTHQSTSQKDSESSLTGQTPHVRIWPTRLQWVVPSLTVNSHMQGASSELSSTYSPKPNPLSPPDSHSNSNLDHCHHVNTGTHSIMYFNAHSLIPKFDY